jgi:hypothetical protein
MAFKITRFVNLLLVALLAGNGFRPPVAVYPALGLLYSGTLGERNSRWADSRGIRRDDESDVGRSGRGEGSA